MEQRSLFEEIETRRIDMVPVDTVTRPQLTALMAEMLLQALRQTTEESKDADQ